MLVALYAIAVLTLGLFLVAGVRLLKLSRPTEDDLFAQEIDPSRYKPMERLLRNEDFLFLAACGVNWRDIRRARSQRRGIFRQYLRSLSVDFGRIAGSLRLAMVDSNKPRPDLATALFRARMVFAYAVVMMEVRLSLHAIGWTGVAFNVQPLIAALENMREQYEAMGALSPSAA
ncbi:MAG: hypothetical protein JWO80_125 [Bryobacterales bacterium]|nr:hypothetical protein [Bryobacterales bacterium]